MKQPTPSRELSCEPSYPIESRPLVKPPAKPAVEPEAGGPLVTAATARPPWMFHVTSLSSNSKPGDNDSKVAFCAESERSDAGQEHAAPSSNFLVSLRKVLCCDVEQVTSLHLSSQRS